MPSDSDSAEHRAIMRSLWRSSGLTCGDVMGRMGLDLPTKGAEYERIRRILAGVTSPRHAQEAGAILAALGLGVNDPGRQLYAAAFLRVDQLRGIGAFARTHGRDL